MIPGTVSAGAVFGVPIRLHFTFLLLMGFLAVFGLGGSESGLYHALYLVLLFVSVLLHELGHALVSKGYGIHTLEIVMFPIGGVARLEKTPKPKQELWVALAGPAVNLAIGIALLVWLKSRGALVGLEDLMQPRDANLLERVALGNIVLAVFNLLPAFPMDGGRVLRSILAMFLSGEKATLAASTAGRVLAIGMGLYGLISMQFFLVFIAFFVYLGAAQEGAAALGQTLLEGVPVRTAMITDFRALAHGDTVRDAANLLLSTSQQDFPVLNGGRVTGLLGRSALMQAMASQGPDGYVAGVMNREFARVEPQIPLADALPLVARAGSCALVMEGERLVGLLTTENVSEYLILSHLDRMRKKPGA